jgi:hypothetical protein
MKVKILGLVNNMNEQYIWEIVNYQHFFNNTFIKTLNDDIFDHFVNVSGNLQLHNINTNCDIDLRLSNIEILGVYNPDVENKYKITLFSFSKDGEGKLTLRNKDGYGLKLSIIFTDSELEHINNHIF